MENEHVLSGLIRKRSEIAGQIEHTQFALRQLVADLDSIDAAIKLFDPSADIPAIKPRQYPPRHAAFRGEMMRHVMGCLRLADGKPVTTRDIALVVMKARVLSEPGHPVLALTLRASQTKSFPRLSIRSSRNLAE